jgi:hypothetical protein
METKCNPILDTLESFFKDGSEDLVEIMESMLYEWYQHYALENYPREHINKVVNGAFRVNELLLKLSDAALTMKREKELKTDLSSPEEHINLLYAV